MLFSPTSVILDGYSMVNSVNSTPFRIEHYSMIALQCVYTGSPVGSLKLQVSLDQGSDPSGTGVTNWSDVADSSISISAAGDTFYDLSATCAKWIRAVYTFTSGTGSLTIKAFAKGAR